MAAGPRLGQARARQPGEGALAAVTGRVKQIVLIGHRFGCQKATSGDRAGHDTSPARRPLPCFEQHRRAEPAGVLGRIADPLDLGVWQPQRTPRLALDDPPAHSRTQVHSQIAARAAWDQLRPPLQQLRIKCARSRPVAGVKFQVYYPSRSCPQCVHSGAHASDDPGRPQDPSQDAVNAGRWLADQDGLAVVSSAGTFIRSRPWQVLCPVAPARSSAFAPPCTLPGPLHRARMNQEAEGLPDPVRKPASTIERPPWLPAVAIDIAPGTDHYPYRASGPSTH